MDLMEIGFWGVNWVYLNITLVSYSGGLGQETGYPNRLFVVFFSLSRQMSGNTLNLATIAQFHVVSNPLIILPRDAL
jgi:hypothetical protein